MAGFNEVDLITSSLKVARLALIPILEKLDENRPFRNSELQEASGVQG